MKNVEVMFLLCISRKGNSGFCVKYLFSNQEFVI